MARHPAATRWDRENPRREYKRDWERKKRRQSLVPCKAECGGMVVTYRATNRKHPGYCQRCALARTYRGSTWDYSTI